MKKTLLIAALATFSLGAFAQRGDRGPFLTNRAFDNWFISAGGGVNIYYGEFDGQAKFSKRMAPALDISLGKWFTPSVGARIQYSGLKAKGLAGGLRDPFISSTTANSKGFYPEKFKVSFIHADFLWNLSNALGGYKSRRWEFVPFVGFGGAFAKGVDNVTKRRELALDAGLINNFRVNHTLGIKLELRGMLVNQRFDGTVGGRKGEGMASATLGLTYRFGKRGFDVPQKVAPADYTSYNNRIKTLEGELANADKRINQLVNDLNAAKNSKVTTGQTQIVVPETAIFFRLNRHDLTEKEMINVRYLAEAIKKMAKDRKFKLIGNADSVTGSADYNMKLSQRRAKAVYDALVAAGVSPSQLEIVAHGDTKEPFDHKKPALNRVLIVE